MRHYISALLISTALTAPAGAQGLGVGVGAQDSTSRSGTGVVVRPGDVVSFTSVYALRALNSSHMTGLVNAVKLRRSSDSLELDVKIGTDGELALGPAITHCTAVTCFVRNWYNLGTCGAPCDGFQNTPANQPVFVFNCNGTRPCIETNLNTKQIITALFTPATGVVSMYAVVTRLTVDNQVVFHQTNNQNRMAFTTTANQWTMSGGTSGNIPRTNATEGQWHVAVGVINGADSWFNIDGDDGTVGNVVGSTTAVATRILAGGGGGGISRVSEAGFSDNVAWNAGQRQSLAAAAGPVR